MIRRLCSKIAGRARGLVAASLIATVVGLAPQPAVAQAQWPFHVELSLAAGTANVAGVTWTYSNGVNRGVFSAFKITDLQIITTPAVTGTDAITWNRIRSGATNAYPFSASVSSGATYTIIANTNSGIWNFQGDGFQFSTANTNAHIFSITGVEQ